MKNLATKHTRKKRNFNKKHIAKKLGNITDKVAKRGVFVAKKSDLGRIDLSQSITPSEINKYFTNQIGFDIETRGTDLLKRDILQLGFAGKSGSLFEINVQQPQDFSPSQLQRFHHRNMGLDSIALLLQGTTAKGNKNFYNNALADIIANYISQYFCT